ncbi:hypothetical protein GCM10009608_03030 [Pseudonocardia alaniniphila]
MIGAAPGAHQYFLYDVLGHGAVSGEPESEREQRYSHLLVQHSDEGFDFFFISGAGSDGDLLLFQGTAQAIL